MTGDATPLIIERLNRITAQLELLPEMQRDIRMLRAAINDFARTNVTVGEIEALHTDINRLQEKSIEMDARLRALETR
jgi:hypothetical protein